MKLAILNTSIVTADGDYTIRTVGLVEARDLVAAATTLDSAVGHDATADLLTDLLGREIQVNRQLFEQQVGQAALVFKLNGRPAPGVELDLAGLNEVGYTLRLLTRTA